MHEAPPLAHQGLPELGEAVVARRYVAVLMGCRVAVRAADGRAELERAAPGPRLGLVWHAEDLGRLAQQPAIRLSWTEGKAKHAGARACETQSRGSVHPVCKPMGRLALTSPMRSLAPCAGAMQHDTQTS